ncbi:hypothetical protein AN958_05395 [Leucoagaricus sp. SymC.cos]|nr:hypothetical protein AN958_05395 [Leucoagaricus sp. SymC.cos]
MYHYLRLRMFPPNKEALAVRKSISNALLQASGLSAERIFIDMLAIAGSGEECVLRVRSEDAPMVSTALISWEDGGKFSLVKESPFLPSLLAEPFLSGN